MKPPEPEHPPLRAVHTALLALGVAVVYFAAARLGLALAFVEEKVTLVWPPTGVALAALLIFGYRALPGVMLGAFAANLSVGSPLLFCAATAVGNPLEALVGAWVLQRFADFDSGLRRVRDALALVGVGVLLGPPFSATIGVAGLYASGGAPWSGLGWVWLKWCLGDGMGVLLVTPALLTWARGGIRGRLKPRKWEFAALITLLAGAAGVAFFKTFPKGLEYLALPYFLLPLLCWAAIRFGPQGAGTAMLLTSAVALAGTVAGHGPFAHGAIQQNLAKLMEFMSMTALVSLVLGAVLAERNAAIRRVVAANAELEKRVEERTRELADANEKLTARARTLEGSESTARNNARDAEEARRLAEQAGEDLHKSRERFDLAVRGSSDGIWDWDMTTNQVYFSPRWKAMIGHKDGDFPDTYAEWEARLHPEDRDRTLAALTDYLEGRAERYGPEFRMRHKDGSYRWILARGVALYDAAGKPYRMAGSHADITDRKRAEEQIKSALVEKEVMLQEIHHRVRNNLQIVSSLLNLQADDHDDPALRKAFAESQQRIRSMALIHEMLYQRRNLAEIDFGDYLRSLVPALFRSYSADARRIAHDIQADRIALRPDTAVPLALIVNELVTNSLAHAFPGGRDGRISIECRRCGGAMELTVRDDGIGLPADFSNQDSTSLGLSLVGMMVTQLEGRLEVRGQGGATFVLTLTPPETAAAPPA